MVVLQKPALERISLVNLHARQGVPLARIPVVDLLKPDATAMVRACEEMGFFKVTNHGIPAGERAAGAACPVGYGNKKIGPNGDVGWLEYLLMQVNSGRDAAEPVSALLKENGAVSFSPSRLIRGGCAEAGCRVLELLAEGLGLAQRNALSRLLVDEESDSMFRLNHYPPCPPMSGRQVISVLHSNNINGLQISLRDGSWVSVPADQSSFFVNVGDSLQVMTNGRFRSVRHRVLLGSSTEPRLAPLPVLMADGERSLYREFTWAEYKKAAYNTRLADNRLGLFELWRGAR
ncbi:unnamed protein product [Spirodela intermedia]|uniref:Isopenicillin N synthase-like Fe(2+) 2OG dioxygenase domain-containing protein n=1 Tax=Spirodela intermedia TaxID=51605 RepID=A0A7I8JSS6_SPIIN|nr:unnamed protein product [Spirodela intermedia]CAA6673179.1 unnamed protein product [Spirodela intermedia]